MPAGPERPERPERSPQLDAPDAIGRYELLLELGRGGMAVLYLARARGVGGFARMFAIKRILPHLAADPAFVEMFLEEGRIAARLSHPNLCPVFELGQDRGELFLVMDYLDGVAWETLALAAPRGPAGLALAAGVLAQACEGLHHAHTFRDVDGTALPIVHRDVSPQNLLVSSDGTCRVLDFGVSKIATDRRRTRTGVRKGKLPYMAPEQVRGEPLDARADVWAVGVMLWEALTGERLFDRDTDFLTYQAITEAAVPPVGSRVAGYPAAVDRVIARSLARDRDQRHATARELGHDLLQLAGEVGGAASREAIADAMTRLCGDQLTARRREIAAALARRAAAEAAATRPGAAAGEPAGADRDAAATVSMAMRKDAIVVRHRGRRRGRWIAGVVGLAAIAAGIAAVSLVRSRREPGGPVPPAAAPSIPARAASAPPAPAPPDPAPAPAAASPAVAPSAAAPSAPGSAPGSSRHVAVRGAVRGASGRSAPAAGSAVPASAPGWYAIDSTPYATIFIDDREIGDTPLDRIALPAGSHRVRAVLADGRQRTFAITIAPDQKTSQGTLRW